MLLRSLKYTLFEMFIISLVVLIFNYIDGSGSIGGSLLISLLFFFLSLYPIIKYLFNRILWKHSFRRGHKLLAGGFFPIVYFPLTLWIFGFSVDEILQRAFVDSALFSVVLICLATINAHDVATNLPTNNESDGERRVI